MRTAILTAALIALSGSPIVTASADNRVGEATYMIGPVVGLPAPALDGASEVRPDRVSAARGEKGTALVFVRSADWCPYCRKQLKALKDAAGPLAEAGWDLAALSYDSSAVLAEFARAENLNYRLYSDPDSDVIAAFNLLNTDIREGSRSWGIPHPAVVFVRNDGTVAAVLREDGYKTRPQIDMIVETAELLNAATGS